MYHMLRFNVRKKHKARKHLIPYAIYFASVLLMKGSSGFVSHSLGFFMPIYHFDMLSYANK